LHYQQTGEVLAVSAFVSSLRADTET